MEFCTFDLDGVRRRLGTRWQPYADYTVARAGTPTVQAAAGAGAGGVPDGGDQVAWGDVGPNRAARYEVSIRGRISKAIQEALDATE